jgi:plasmid stabilization system protein ParE
LEELKEAWLVEDKSEIERIWEHTTQANTVQSAEYESVQQAHAQKLAGLCGLKFGEEQ